MTGAEAHMLAMWLYSAWGGSYHEPPKIIYAATLTSGSRIIFGVYSDGGVWLRFIRPATSLLPGSDLSFSLTPEAWKTVRSLPESGLGHFFALAG